LGEMRSLPTRVRICTISRRPNGFGLCRVVGPTPGNRTRRGAAESRGVHLRLRVYILVATCALRPAIRRARVRESLCTSNARRLRRRRGITLFRETAASITLTLAAVAGQQRHLLVLCPSITQAGSQCRGGFSRTSASFDHGPCEIYELHSRLELRNLASLRAYDSSCRCRTAAGVQRRSPQSGRVSVGP